jgi:Ser/Thr protein kinase RdoA (MazF antagonist)
MNNDILNAILEQYMLGQAASFVSLPKTTSGNDAFVVTLSNGDEYVVKKLARQSEESAINECDIQRILEQNGILTPHYILSQQNSVVVNIANSQYAVSKKLTGSRQVTDTLELACDMGRVLAKMHNIVNGVEITANEQQWFRPDNALRQLDIYDGPEKQYIYKTTSKLFALFDTNLPITFTHGDLHTKNIFSADDKVTVVFDFESADYSLRILDIARTYLTYRKSTDLNSDEILKNILAGYGNAASSTLSMDEKKNLNNAFMYVALITLVSIYNHGNYDSSAKYLEIVHTLDTHPVVIS